MKLTIVRGVIPSIVLMVPWAASLVSAQQPRPLTGLVPQHITISVADVAVESKWYARVLGFTLQPPDNSNPDFLNYHMLIPGFRVDLIQSKGSTRPPSADPLFMHQGWIHLAFSVPNLVSALDQLRALGTDVKSASVSAAGVPTRLALHDPEGNEIELFQQETARVAP